MVALQKGRRPQQHVKSQINFNVHRRAPRPSSSTIVAHSTTHGCVAWEGAAGRRKGRAAGAAGPRQSSQPAAWQQRARVERMRGKAPEVSDAGAGAKGCRARWRGVACAGRAALARGTGAPGAPSASAMVQIRMVGGVPVLQYPLRARGRAGIQAPGGGLRGGRGQQGRWGARCRQSRAAGPGRGANQAPSARKRGLGAEEQAQQQRRTKRGRERGSSGAQERRQTSARGMPMSFSRERAPGPCPPRSARSFETHLAPLRQTQAMSRVSGAAPMRGACARSCVG
jgi:hypothetical protein